MYVNSFIVVIAARLPGPENVIASGEELGLSSLLLSVTRAEGDAAPSSLLVPGIGYISRSPSRGAAFGAVGVSSLPSLEST